MQQEIAKRNGLELPPLWVQSQDQNIQNSTTGIAETNDLKVYKKCPVCGAKCYETQKFCNNCGRNLNDVEITDESKTE